MILSNALTVGHLKSSPVLGTWPTIWGFRKKSCFTGKTKEAGPDACSNVNCSKGGKLNQWSQNRQYQIIQNCVK